MNRWLRTMDYAGRLTVAISVILRCNAISWDLDNFFDSDWSPLFMLVVLALPAATIDLQRPFTAKTLNQRLRYLLTTLNLLAIIWWWCVFGPEWLDDYAYWNSRYMWLGSVVLCAASWYVWMGVAAATGEDTSSGAGA